MKKLLSIIIMLGLMAGCVRPFDQELAATMTAPLTEAEAEQYAVYDALIAAWPVRDETRLIVIEDHTRLGFKSDYLDKHMENLQLNYPDLAEEIIIDFKTKNQQSQPLKPLFNLGVDYALISDEELKEIFESAAGWDTFYRKYPNSQGVMTLSNVGFNANLDEALVYVGNGSHWLAGSGYFMLLSKDKGRWTIREEIMLWIS